jgi:hypothetical protein
VQDSERVVVEVRQHLADGVAAAKEEFRVRQAIFQQAFIRTDLSARRHLSRNALAQPLGKGDHSLGQSLVISGPRVLGLFDGGQRAFVDVLDAVDNLVTADDVATGRLVDDLVTEDVVAAYSCASLGRSGLGARVSGGLCVEGVHGVPGRF